MARTSGPYTKVKVPSGFWVYSPTRVGGGGVAVAGDGDQVGEGRLDQAGLAGAGRPVHQGRHARLAQLAQGLDVGHVGQCAGLVELPVRSGDRAGRSRRGGRGRRGGGRGHGGGGGGSRRRGGGGGGPGRQGCPRRDGGGGGGGVRLVADGLAGYEVGLAVAGQGGERVADRAGRPAQRLGDAACPLGSGVVGEVLGYLAAQLAVAEPALRGGGGGGHRDYLHKCESELSRHWRAHAFRHYPEF
jgi:hypothetical protein